MNTKDTIKPPPNNSTPKICVLLPTLGKSQSDTWATNPDEVEGFQKFMSSFTNALVPQYNFSLYLGYDIGDQFYDNEENHAKVRAWFESRLAERDVTLDVVMKAYPKAHTNNVYFWNHLAYQAYTDGCDYNFQLGDDMMLVGNRWDLLIERLQTKSRRPNFGVIEPTHTGGNIYVHVSSFVHRTHYEIFGHHFPPEFYNWWADDWMTNVYRTYESALWLEPAQGFTINHISHQRYNHCGGHSPILSMTLERSKGEAEEWLRQQPQQI